MVHIKAVFPYNYYLLRKVKVKAGGDVIAQVGHKETVTLEAVPGKTLSFKLDYHKAKLELPQTGGDVYIILYFDLRPYFPFNVTDVMFRNALRASIVDKQTFDSFDVSFYEQRERKPVEPDTRFYYLLFAGMMVSLEFVLVPFMKQTNSQPVANFALIMGLITFLGFISIFFARKKISRHQFNLRMLAFGVLSVILLAFLKLNMGLKVFTLIVALSLILIPVSGTRHEI